MARNVQTSDRVDTSNWVTPQLVSALVARPERTILNWAAKGLIASMRDPETGRLLVNYPAAKATADEAKVWWEGKRAELGYAP